MALIRERARAKVNLTLSVLGRRPDGYHEIDSLVAFAAVGDTLVLDTGRPAAVEMTGPFAASVAGHNLVATTLDRVGRQAPHLALGAVHLEKLLPVAAGLGGGSADAAAVLRAVRRANPLSGADVDWAELAASLGADVPVCLADRASWMGGTGNEVAPLAAALPDLFAVLVNPRVPVPPDKTARVFAGLSAPALQGRPAPARRPGVATRADLLAFLRCSGNDLESPALALVPAAGEVLAALRGQEGAELVRMSGGGPTCFALFATPELAATAAARLGRDKPLWWIAATTLS